MEHTVEQFVRWEPALTLPRILDPTSIEREFGKNGSLRFTSAEPIKGGRVFRIEFARPLALRSGNESYRLKMIESLQNELPWATFKVEESEWVEWFHDETFGAYRDWPVQHFSFIGEDIIEVLSTESPTFAEIK
jgi:hypothetical protein